MRKRARMCESTLTSDDDDDENRIAYRARNIFHRHFRKRAYIYIQMFGIYVDRVVLALLYILTSHIAISYVCIFHYSLRVEHCASDVLLSASLVPPTLPRIYTSVWLLYSFVAMLKRCNFSRWTWHDMLLLCFVDTSSLCVYFISWWKGWCLCARCFFCHRVCVRLALMLLSIKQVVAVLRNWPAALYPSEHGSLPGRAYIKTKVVLIFSGLMVILACVGIFKN